MKPAPIPKHDTSPQSSYFQIRAAQLPPALREYGAPPTKPGVRGYPGVDDAQLLLFQTMLKRKVRGPVLDLSAMGGLLASLPGVELRPVEGAAAALTALRADGLEPVVAAPGDDLQAHFPEPARTVACVLAGDRGTAYAQAQVSWAHAHTPPGGKLYLAGDKAKGFDRYVRAASRAFGTGETIARDGGMRVAVLTRRPGPTPELPAAESYEDHGVKVAGLPGVFSAARADKATGILLDTLSALPGLDLSGQAVLDLGCGTGLIGAWAAQRGAAVTLADGDLQSVRSARLTLEANGLAGEAVHSDVDSELGERRFDLILTNPPFHVGRGVVLDVAREFIAAARRRLNPGGRLILVANDFLPYEAELAALGPAEVLTHERGFKVLSACKRA
ncbi:class I SAM-dependent methyltransferase [Deinococcus sp. Marseille-Q6407]|uniref:class I SAM-dependent methyltransferase n=1 Tax=Deinococcus sp. Marseille-Q6407 TaxID=2969223 RepID=UPI0021BE6172|nr:class I SAM-dependent methyltransferase [Deinococcus sp. Marseille-Q6407]